MTLKNFWVYVLIALTGLFVLFAEGFQKNTCYCWDEIEQNETLKNGLITFQYPKPPPKRYEYTAIKTLSPTEFRECLCDDVTRMESVLIVQDPVLYESAEDSSDNNMNLDQLQANVTKAFKELLKVDNITSRTRGVQVTLKDTAETPISKWILKVTSKGRDITPEELKTTIKNLTKDPENSYSVKDVGSIDAEALAFTILRCSGEPPPPPENGDRIWKKTQVYPGEKSKYKCNDGFFLVNENNAFAQCSHETIEWEVPDFSLTCAPGCHESPPAPPYFTVRNWNSSLRSEGDVVNYTCMSGYRKENPELNGQSTCTEGKWTVLDPDFKCEQILCSLDIPQVPPYGYTNWNGEDRYIDAKITYFCKDEYRSTVGEDVEIQCDDRGYWTLPKDEYRCFKLGDDDFRYDPQTVIDYDVYFDADGNMKQNVKVEHNWFWAVTIPAIIALVLVTWCCMCCTRIDSPIFILCTGNTNNKEYVDPI